MRRLACVLALVVITAGCVDQGGPRAPDLAVAPAASSAALAPASRALPTARSRAGIASLPDKGLLLEYGQPGTARREGAYTWHRAEVSEEHALQAVMTGKLRLTSPSGRPLGFSYERHFEHASGDWTWIGRSEDGGEALITFGEKAVFGSIDQGEEAPLQLNVRDGSLWVVETDRSLIADIHNSATRPRGPDYLVPPAAGVPVAEDLAGMRMEGDVAMERAVSATATVTVDLLLGYTPGFVTSLGGQSQAVTRLNNLVDYANQAYVTSQVDMRLRLVHAMQVNYADATSNGDTLEKMTGYRSGVGSIAVDPAFNALRLAREQYGADLVSLVRDFNEPEQDGCGIAWLLGGGRTAITSSSSSFGYSVVSDGQDVGADGKSYGCRVETLAHEVGHNLGSQHDRTTATVDGTLNYGAFDYSFGYKTTPTTGNFYTVMAYGDTGQVTYRVFSNPAVTICGERPCGVANQADNARSLRQTAPVIASFRAGVASGVFLDLVAIKKNGVSKTEVRTLSGPNNFQVYSGSYASVLGRTGFDESWNFDFADFNRDGVFDMYAIKKMGASGRTEVHVLNGANGFGSYLMNVATILGRTGTDNSWEFKVADFNRDTRPDLYAIKKQGVGSRAEVRVINGADNFQSYLFSGQTVLGPLPIDYSWNFELGDFNQDGNPDLFAFKKVSGTGRTEVQVLNAVGGFRSYLLSRAAILGQTGSDNSWNFKVGDFNRDGSLDVYAIKKLGANNRTEVHVLNGANQYQSYLLNIATVLGATGADASWKFGLRPSR